MTLGKNFDQLRNIFKGLLSEGSEDFFRMALHDAHPKLRAMIQDELAKDILEFDEVASKIIFCAASWEGNIFIANKEEHKRKKAKAKDTWKSFIRID